MEGPTYVTLSAQVALQNQLDVVANNVANANTTGFHADRQLFQTYLERLSVPGDQVAYVQDRATYIDQTSGPLERTDNPFDVAIEGNGYLGTLTPQGTSYTRDGRLRVSPTRTLVDMQGHPVLGADRQPIQLPEGFSHVVIQGDGTISVVVNGQTLDAGQIGRFATTTPLALRKAANGQVVDPSNAMRPTDPADPAVRLVQGTVEGSTVQPVKEIANMTELSRAYERLQSLISDDNDRERKMISALAQSN